MEYLNALSRRSRWLSPAELLSQLAIDRRVLEVASVVEPSSRARDQWARVRFVIDQARAWSDVQHGGLREYVVWASHQAQDAARVAEALLPETDLDVVRVMTVHAAKGLEFGMVVLSGMTSQPKNETGVRLLWQKRGYAVKIGGSVETNDFADAAPIDEQMDDAERRRLLYVAATRARDHLVVSLHRAEGALRRPRSCSSTPGQGTFRVWCGSRVRVRRCPRFGAGADDGGSRVRRVEGAYRRRTRTLEGAFCANRVGTSRGPS